jgi:methionine biosynthesis protein MetW
VSRADFQAIARWVEPGSRVLDLGCGDGDLLAYLQSTKGVKGYGIEIEPERVGAAIRHGVNVIQTNLETGLPGFGSGSFDTVILSQTLQAMHNTAEILQEMLRVGKEGIVTFPNFGYWKNRLQVVAGIMPKSDAMPYEWYNTPNVHLCTLNDFEALCAELNITITQRSVMTQGHEVQWLPNLLGGLAVYRLRANRC